jgi:hypothetical protein
MLTGNLIGNIPLSKLEVVMKFGSELKMHELRCSLSWLASMSWRKTLQPGQMTPDASMPTLEEHAQQGCSERLRITGKLAEG